MNVAMLPQGLPKHILGWGVGKSRAKVSRLEMDWPVVPYSLRTLFLVGSDIFSLFAQNWRYKGELRDCDKVATPVPGLR